ncbi:MAG: hypothetical protein LBH98_00430 [Chitinispirillales bacterium]|jgi:hypothetical protein|nr:hypothetical protein [Chitinispirillales bacterium]
MFIELQDVNNLISHDSLFLQKSTLNVEDKEILMIDTLKVKVLVIDQNN